MKKTRILSLLASAVAAVALLIGCGTDFENGNDGLVSLELSSVSSSDMPTRAVIDGTAFPTAMGNIGLFLYADESASKPYGEGYANVQYSYNSTKEKWTASPSIKVGSTPGHLYGYYPYNSASTDVKAIPVASSLNGDDVMYAEKVSNVTDATASQTAITMNHALARVSITVKNNGYAGAAKLSEIKFSGAEIAPEGTLNALDGSVTATKSEVTLDVTGDDQTITTAGTIYECLLVPSKAVDGKQDVNLTLTIDGEDKTANLSGDNGVIIARNTKSNITIGLSNTGIAVQTVSVEDWKVIEVGGHKVTVKLSDDVADAGIADNLIVQCKSDGESVIIESYSKNDKPLVVRINDGSLIAPTENGRINTFAISDITKDITATLAYARKIKVFATFHADFMPNVDEYPEDFDKGKEYLEGRKIVFKVDNVGGYRLDSLVCGQTKVLVDNIELKNISADTEVKAYYTYTDCLGGVFSVSDKTKVRFSKGNLWCSTASNLRNADFHFEDNQYDSNPASDGARSTDHISHFMWCRSALESVKQKYEESGTPSGDTFFTDKADFAVNGVSVWRTLTTEEWQYLFSYDSYDNNTRRDRYKYGVTVCGKGGCLVIVPDDWDLNAKPLQASYDATQWAEAQAAGAVCLPAAGWRDGGYGYASVSNVGVSGGYWFGSPYEDDRAFRLFFEFSRSIFLPDDYDMRSDAYSVRLVTEVK